MSLRAVPLDVAQHQLLEEVGFDLLRRGDQTRGTGILAIALAYRVSPDLGGGDAAIPSPPAPGNVLPFPDRHSIRVGA